MKRFIQKFKKFRKEKSEKSEKPEKSEKTEKSEKIEKSEETEKSVETEKSEKSEETETTKKTHLPLKLDTAFVFQNLGGDGRRIASEFGSELNGPWYTFQEVCCKIHDNFVKVTELHFVASEEHLDVGGVLKEARLENGVASFGSGPHAEKLKAVFEVRQTFITFDWCSYEMPMPIIGGCFIAMGDEREILLGPKFPMTHLFFGAGSEFPSESKHSISKDVSITLQADYAKPSWFTQREYHRIVTPGTAIPDILLLQLQVDLNSAESFILSRMVIELQEFTCVWRHGRFYKEVRNKTLLENEIYDFLPASGTPFKIPKNVYDCKLPDVGPSFSCQGFTRSYGLKTHITLCSKSRPQIALESFFELNMAEVKAERIKQSDATNDERYLGRRADVPERYLMRSFELNAEMEGILESYRQFMSVPELSGYLLRSWQCGTRAVLYLGMEASAGWKPREKIERNDCFKAKPDRKATHVAVKIIDRPIHGGESSTTQKPYLAVCMMHGKQVAGNLSNIDFGRFQRASCVSFYTIGDEQFPLAVYLGRPAGGRFERQCRWNNTFLATPGTKPCDVFDIKFVLPISFVEAQRNGLKREILFHLQRIEIRYINRECHSGCAHERTTLLVTKNLRYEKGCAFLWRSFHDEVPGSPHARAISIPSHVFNIPKVEDLFLMDVAYSCNTALEGTLFFSSLGRNYTFTWSSRLRVTEPEETIIQ